MPTPGPRHEWPGASLARVPYWVYQDEDNYRAELRRIFEGPTWSYACLESDLEKPGDYRLLVRATNNAGDIQSLESTWNRSGYLRNVIESWNLKAV